MKEDDLKKEIADNFRNAFTRAGLNSSNHHAILSALESDLLKESLMMDLQNRAAERQNFLQMQAFNNLNRAFNTPSGLEWAQKAQEEKEKLKKTWVTGEYGTAVYNPQITVRRSDFTAYADPKRKDYIRWLIVNCKLLTRKIARWISR